MKATSLIWRLVWLVFKYGDRVVVGSTEEIPSGYISLGSSYYDGVFWITIKEDE